MKVVAVFQFYFPFVIPRDANWPSAFIGIDFPDLGKQVQLRPRGMTEALFPEDIDRTLSGMTLSMSRISLPQADVNFRTKDRCIDRVEVRVHGEVEDSERVKDPDVQEEFHRPAIRATNSLMEHLRILSGVPFVSGVEADYRPEDGSLHILNPRTTSWFSGVDGSRLPAYEGDINAQADSGAIRSPERGSVTADDLKVGMQSGEQPPLALSVLIDAEEYLILGRLRDSVVCLGTACEIASNEYLASGGRGKSEGRGIKRILRSHKSFAEKRFHLVPIRISGRSLKKEDEETFDQLEEMFQTRNAFVHEGRPRPRPNWEAQTLDEALVGQYLRSSKKAVGWIRGLSNGP